MNGGYQDLSGLIGQMLVCVAAFRKSTNTNLDKSPGFYVTFWQLSTYDLIPLDAKYDEEGSALRALSRREDYKYIAADRSSDRAKSLTASSHRVRRAI